MYVDVTKAYKFSHTKRTYNGVMDFSIELHKQNSLITISVYKISERILIFTMRTCIYYVLYCLYCFVYVYLFLFVLFVLV